MITFEQLEELAHLEMGRFPVTTLFLNLNGGRDARKSEIVLKELIKKQRAELETRSLTRGQAQSVEQDFEALLRWVQNVDRKGSKALAAFSSSAAAIWQSYSLAQPVRDRLVVDAHPHVRPLSHLLHQFRRCLVLLIARDRAALYLVHLGEIAMLDELRGDVPPETRSGFAGTEERRIERHAEDRLRHFAKSLVDRMTAEVRASGPSVLLIGGAPEGMAAFEAASPRAVRDLVIGRLPLGPEAPASEILARTSERVLDHSRRHGIHIVDAAMKEASIGGIGVAGVGPVLRAFGRGEVSAVAVSPRLVRPGLACDACPVLDIDGASCPICGGELVRVPDVVEELVYRALGHAVEVVDVEGHPDLEAAGGMAALLRYRRSAPARTPPVESSAKMGTGRP